MITLESEDPDAINVLILGASPFLSVVVWSGGR